MVELGKLKIHHGDCLDVIKIIPDGSIDIVMTSPPYNCGTAYNSYADNLEFNQYLDWMESLGNELFRVMKADASFFLNVGGTNKLPAIPMLLCQRLMKIFELQNNIVWVKSITLAENSYGHFKPINSNRFLNHNHESIFHFSKKGDVAIDRLAIGVPYQHASNLTRWKHGKAIRCGGNVWYIPYRTVQSKDEKFNHPAGYPVELVEKCIKLHSYTNETVVLDPFLGVGTTLVGCCNLGINGVGIEMDKTYFDSAIDRIKAIL
jgi:site-specific DNA-methyltransferase (adenine-specific)